MNSSKIFREDPSFVAKTLVQEVIVKQMPSTDAAETASTPHHQTDQTSMEEDNVAMPREPEQPPQPPEPSIDIQAIKQEAYDQGVADCTAGKQREIETATRALFQACQKIDTLHESLLEKYRSDIINTVINLTQKIIGHELTTNRDSIAQTLENALQQAIASDEFIVTIHPDDLNAVEHAKTGLMTKIHGLKNIIIQTDLLVSRGGCLIESKTCSVDATIATQLESAQEFLEENTLSFREDGSTPSAPTVEQT